MKYISLMEVMRQYGSYIKDYRSTRQLSYEITSKSFDADVNYTTFDIETGTPDGAGQVMKTVTIRESVNRNTAINPYVPTQSVMPPILEMEWMRAVADLPDGVFSILEHMAYMFMIMIITWGEHMVQIVDENYFNETMERLHIIKEVDDLDDTALILLACELPSISLPKIRSWTLCYMYGTSFQSLMRLCKQQSQVFKELYFHLPILLAMFMVSYEATDLKEWSKSERISIENDLEDLIAGFGPYNIVPGNNYTYGGSTSITQRDKELLELVFNFIRGKIHSMNSNVGLITYTSYTNIRGPEITHASVRLSGIDINWRDELNKAEEEKKANEEPEEDGKFDEE